MWLHCFWEVPWLECKFFHFLPGDQIKGYKEGVSFLRHQGPASPFAYNTDICLPYIYLTKGTIRVTSWIKFCSEKSCCLNPNVLAIVLSSPCSPPTPSFLETEPALDGHMTAAGPIRILLWDFFLLELAGRREYNRHTEPGAKSENIFFA